MSIQSAATLKNFFLTGSFPTQAQFADLIDSSVDDEIKVTAYMDGLSGRPTLAAWEASPTTVDVTAAIQTAITAAAGKPVVFPHGTYSGTTVTVSVAGSVLEGLGATLSLSGGVVISAANVVMRDLAISTSSGTNSVTVAVDGVSGVLLERLTVTNDGHYSGSGAADGVGIQLRNGTTKATVRGCTVSGAAFAGIEVLDSSDNLIEDNLILDGDATVQDSSGICVLVNASGGDSSRNTIRGNRVLDGSQTGIFLQTRIDAYTQSLSDSLIEGNTITAHSVYGIAVYRNESSAPFGHTLYRTRIHGNSVVGITGAREWDSGGGVMKKIYGAGIYVQGAEFSTIQGNSLSNCNQQTDYEQLAPGAIGVANATAVAILGNTINTTSYAGIYWNDSSSLGALGAGLIEGNIIDGAVNDGIRLKRVARVTVRGNTVTRGSRFGIQVDNDAAQLSMVSVDGNTLRGNANTQVYVRGVDGGTVSGNNVAAGGVHGIFVGDATDVVVAGNVVRDHTSSARGIQMGTATLALTNIKAFDNLVTGNSVGIYAADQAGVLFGRNQVTGNTTQWSGAYAVEAVPMVATQTLAAATAITATGVVLMFTCSGAVTSTAAPLIANGSDGQVVRLLNVGTGTLTISDQGTLAGSNLRLTANTVAIGPRQSLELTYSSTVGDWVQTGLLVTTL
jgi:parallel beta-helix repeat protein